MASSAITSASAGSGRISPAEFARLRRPAGARIALDLGLIWGQALLGIALFVASPSWITYVVAILLIGGAQHGCHLASHEGIHYLIRPDHRSRNDLVAAWLFASPVALPFLIYRKRHFVHHRFVSTEQDTKFFYRRNWQGWRSVLELLRGVSVADYLALLWGALSHYRGSRDRYQETSESSASHSLMGRDLIRIAVVQAVIFSAFLLVDPLHFGIPTYYVLLWLVPNFTVSVLFGKLRSTVEHHPLLAETEGAGGEGRYFKGTREPYVRTVVRASWFARLCLTKLNFHYHVEHHLWPQVSYQHLPLLHDRLVEDPELGKGLIVAFDSSYESTLRRLVRGE